MIHIEEIRIKIRNLRLRAIVGIFDWEREKKQDLVINLETQVSVDKALKEDQFEETVDYKSLTKEIIHLVENSNYFLIEKMAYAILELTLNKDKVVAAEVSVDKPHALRFADSVAICVRGSRESNE